MTKSFRCDELMESYIDYIKLNYPYLKTDTDVIRIALYTMVRKIDKEKKNDKENSNNR